MKVQEKKLYMWKKDYWCREILKIDGDNVIYRQYAVPNEGVDYGMGVCSIKTMQGGAKKELTWKEVFEVA